MDRMGVSEINPILHQFVWDDMAEDMEAWLAANRSRPRNQSVISLGVVDSEGEGDEGQSDDQSKVVSEVPFIDAKYRGLTALGLACQLGRRECAAVLLRYGAGSFVGSELGFYPAQEANGLGDRDLMRIMFQARQDELKRQWAKRQASLHSVLCLEVPDFYLEMNWQFSSWVPFVSMLCPSDRYRIWKQGPNIRIDTTLVGFERLTWLRGNVSFLFKVDEENSRFYLIDHEKKVYEEVDKRLEEMDGDDLEKQINLALNTEIVFAEVKQQRATAAAQFTRRQSGLFGMGGDREEVVAGYRTAVYDIPGVELLTRTRREHLRDRKPENEVEDAATTGKRSASPVSSSSSSGIGLSLGLNAEEEEALAEKLSKIPVGPHNPDDEASTKTEIEGYLEVARGHLDRFLPSLRPPPKPAIDAAKYFEAGASAPYIHLGRPLDMKETRKALSPTVWMASDFPLAIAQLLPVFQIMAPTGTHFRRLEEFIRMEMPPGFPVRLEVPIFGFLRGAVTFENYWGWMEGLGEERITPPTSLNGDSYTQNWFRLPKDYAPGNVFTALFKSQHQQAEKPPR